MDVPHGRSRRGHRRPGSRSRSVRGSSPARRATCERPAFDAGARRGGRHRGDRRRPRRRAAVPGRPRRVPRLRPRPALERLPSIAAADQDLPPLRLALHDWVVAWDRRTGPRGSVAGRSTATPRRSTRRLRRAARRAAARARRRAAGRPGATPTPLDLRVEPRSRRVRGRRRVRPGAIAHGDIYQANLTRRLEAPFGGDPWPLYRRLRTGDPSLFAAYLDLGPSPLTGAPRAIAVRVAGAIPVRRRGGPSPRPPDQGHPAARPRPRRTTGALARELLASAKDRAENVMIVDVLRNDLGRVCAPGHASASRACAGSNGPRPCSTSSRP